MLRTVLLAIALTMLAVTPLLGTAFAQSSMVGVKAGDWIQYNVRETGTPIPAYNITWAKMDILSVQDGVITVNVLTKFGNGTLYPENNIHLNVATGAIGDGFFVPVSLNPGDRYSTEYEGIINMTGVQHVEAGGAQRSALVGVSTQSVYNWDRQTGIMIAATSNLTGCVMYTTTGSTNIWAPQIFGLNQNVFYWLVVAIIASVAVLAVVSTVVLKRTKKSSL